MKIYINKKISDVPWSAWIAAAICFYSAYAIYSKYKERLLLFENGMVERAVVTNVPKNCYDSYRMENYAGIHILTLDRDAHIKISYRECISLNLNDTILVRCSENSEKVLRYHSEITKVPRADLYFTFACILLGIIFLVFGNRKNSFM